MSRESRAIGRMHWGLLAALVVLAWAEPLDAQTAPASWHADGSQGAVVTGTAASADAALAVLQEGGNAVDAAVTGLMVLSVTDSGNFCFGGEVPLIVYDAQRGVVEVVSGMGTAPRLATRDHFEKLGGIPKQGAASAAVPAALDAMLVALDRFGTITFQRAAEPMLAALAGKSDAWCRDLTTTIQELIAAERLASDRRAGLRNVANYFYRGPIARRMDAWSKENGGLIRYSDLATFSTRVEDPAVIDFQGYTVCKCGPWTQGPFLLQSLSILDGLDLAASGHNSPDYVHLVTESMKLAFADRDAYYADPLFHEVPLDALLSHGYGQLRRSLIDPRQASSDLRPGDPRRMKALRDRAAAAGSGSGINRDTTTCLAADRWGNVVAATPSGWGGVVAGDTGVVLGTRLQSFNNELGQPNCIEPGKRPRITLTPTIVLSQKKPVLAISVAGGDLQDQVSLQLLLGSLVFGMTPDKVVAAPRFSTSHHIGSFGQTPPNLANLALDDGFDSAVATDLGGRGHQVHTVKAPIASPCVLRLDRDLTRAAGDPKARREARAF